MAARLLDSGRRPVVDPVAEVCEKSTTADYEVLRPLGAIQPAEAFAKSLFTMRRLDDFMPKFHRLRSIRTMTDQAQVKVNFFAQMYEVDKSVAVPVEPERSRR